MAITPPTVGELTQLVEQVSLDVLAGRHFMNIDLDDLRQEAWMIALTNARYCETSTSCGAFNRIAYRVIRSQLIHYVARSHSPVSAARYVPAMTFKGLRAVPSIEKRAPGAPDTRVERGTPLADNVPSLCGVTSITPEQIAIARVDHKKYRARVAAAAKGHPHPDAVEEVLAAGWSCAESARDHGLRDAQVRDAVRRAKRRLKWTKMRTAVTA